MVTQIYYLTKLIHCLSEIKQNWSNIMDLLLMIELLQVEVKPYRLTILIDNLI